MVCKNCGNEIQDNVAYCSKCGLKVDSFEGDTKYKIKNKKNLLLILGILSVIILSVSYVLSKGMPVIGLSEGEKAAIIAANEVEKIILNPEYMKITGVYYKKAPNHKEVMTQEVRITVSAVSQGGAPVFAEFLVAILESGEIFVDKKFTDLEIYTAGPNGAYMQALNDIYFGISKAEIEAKYEKIDAQKIDSEFRKN